MKKVFFATSFATGAKPTSDGHLSIWDGESNAYLALDEASAASAYKNLVLQTYRDGEILSFPINTADMSYSYGALAASAAAVVNVTPNIPVAADVSYLCVALAGEPHTLPKYTKKYEATGVATVQALVEKWQTAIGANCDDIPGITFTATEDNAKITLTVDSGYYDKKLIAWMEGDVEADTIAYTPGASGLTANEIKQLEKDADTTLGRRNQTFRTLVGDNFDLDSGYLADAVTHSAVIRTRSIVDYVTKGENKMEKELLLFYDDNATAGDGDLGDVVEWVLGIGDMPATP